MPALPIAHGLVQRANLPIPEWLFGWAAALVLLVSFAALAVLWSDPKLETDEARPILGRFGRFLVGAPVRALCGAVGFGLLVVTIWTGFAGDQVPTDNFAPTFVYVVFWVGFVIASIFFGDVFRAFNPWAAPARLLLRERTARPYPEWLGRYPAALGILCFTWLELASQVSEEPRNVAISALVYSVATWTGMAIFGWRAWLDRGEAFSVYYNLFSRLSPLEARDGSVCIRRPLSAITRLEPLPGTVPMLAVMIGTVTFDGFSAGSIWKDITAEIEPTLGERFTATLGLIACVLLIGAFYRYASGRKAVSFVHSLVPIAVVYVLAHYLTLLVFQGQAMSYLASDPLGHGWDLFGTAAAGINYGVLSQNVTWYLQVGFVVTGHVAALTLAHDRALALYPEKKQAVRSQYSMLVVMIGFTSLALWLLASANV